MKTFLNQKVYTLIYLLNGIREMEFIWVCDTMYEAKTKRGGGSRKLRIIEDGLYPRLVHITKNGTQRRIGNYPTTYERLKYVWSASLQEQYADEIKAYEKKASSE